MFQPASYQVRHIPNGASSEFPLHPRGQLSHLSFLLYETSVNFSVCWLTAVPFPVSAEPQLVGRKRVGIGVGRDFSKWTLSFYTVHQP
jgi:hypothetical protein